MRLEMQLRLKPQICFFFCSSFRYVCFFILFSLLTTIITRLCLKSMMMTIHTHHDQINTWTNVNVRGSSCVSSLRYVFFYLLFALLMIIITSTSMKIAMTINVHQHRTNIGMNVNRARDASVSRCHVEFRLEHSPSVSVYSRPFPILLHYSFLLFYSSPSLSVASTSILYFHFRLSYPFSLPH